MSHLPTYYVVIELEAAVLHAQSEPAEAYSILHHGVTDQHLQDESHRSTRSKTKNLKMHSKRPKSTYIDLVVVVHKFNVCRGSDVLTVGQGNHGSNCIINWQN